MLVNSKVDCTKRTSTYLLLDNVLVDAVNCGTVILAVCILGASMQSLLDLARRGGFSTMVSQRTFVGRGRSKDDTSASTRQRLP